MERPSSNLHLAISSLVGAQIIWALSAALGFAGLLPKLAIVINGVSLAVGFFFLFLLWWRHRAGYYGALAFGIYGIVEAFAIPPFVARSPGEFTFAELFPVGIVFIVLSVVLIIATYRLSKGKD